VAVAKYFSNLEAQGKGPKTIKAYRAAVDPFAAQCRKACVEEVSNQTLFYYNNLAARNQPIERKSIMSALPSSQRRSGNTVSPDTGTRSSSMAMNL
jgi:hypothetical protein